jgi:uncharacterized protein
LNWLSFKLGEGDTMAARLNYVEMPGGDVPVTRDFYASAFGWSFTDYGPGYASTTTNDVDLGLDGSGEATKAPLPVILVDDLDAAQAAVLAAGGAITVPQFSFPGGRRFHFTDPAGNTLAVWVHE